MAEHTVVREMGFSLPEWSRCLPEALAPWPCQWGQNDVQVSVGGGVVYLNWTVLPSRRIAQLVLPRLRVALAFEGVPAPEQQAFMTRLDLYLRRGGG